MDISLNIVTNVSTPTETKSKSSVNIAISIAFISQCILIASNVNILTGEIDGANCSKEAIRRF